MKAYTRIIVQATLLLLLPLGCASILGIEDAELKEGADTGDGSGGSAGGGGERTLCETYCDTVMQNCTGSLAVYSSLDQCQALCVTIPGGQPGDDAVDTVHCRLNQANAAGETQEPAEHCPAAGLGGEGICGTNCDALCRSMVEFCSDQHASNAACLDDCEPLNDLHGFNVLQNEGATVQCRIWHVGAATVKVDPHCGHAAGDAPCVGAPPQQ